MIENELKIWLKQLNLYAQDLAQLYRQEREARERLAEEKIVLEYKQRELEALNKLFQKHIREKQYLEGILLRLISGLKEILTNYSHDQMPARLKKLIVEVEDELARRRESF